MKTRLAIGALMVVAAAVSCAKVDSAGSAGTGGQALGGRVGAGSSGGVNGVAGGGVVSGSGGNGRGTVSGGGGMGGEGMCGLETFPVVRRPVDIFVLLDRSQSMGRDSMDKDIPAGSAIPSKWNQIVPALTEVIGKVGGDTSWGLKVFPEDGAQCVQATLTAKIDVMISPMNAVAISQGITAAKPLGNGTPTGAAFDVVTGYLRSQTNDHRKYILFATDGQPSCAGTVGSLSYTGGGSLQAVGAATAAIAAAAQAGYHTFVVGVATKETDTKTLDEWATAGQEPRRDPNPLATKFYLGSTKEELVNVFATITNVAQTCVFGLSKPPPVPENIAVKVMGKKVQLDRANTDGWNYTDNTNTAVQVFGPWCDMIKAAAADKVQIIFGCPNIEIP